MTTTTTRNTRTEFSLTAFSDEIVEDMVRIERRGTYIRRGYRAISRKVHRVLVIDHGWGLADQFQFWRNCKDMAGLSLNAD